MAQDRTFDNARAAALTRLDEARRTGAADPPAARVIDALNAHAAWFTSSSCSGRVQVLGLARPGDKAGSVVLARWHEIPADPEVVARDLSEALAARPEGLVAWVFVQPPVLHLVARDLEAAMRLLRWGATAGLKASHLRDVGPGGRVTVELAGTSRIEAPAAADDLPPSAAWMQGVARLAPDLLARGHASLARLEATARGVDEDTAPRPARDPDAGPSVRPRGDAVAGGAEAPGASGRPPAGGAARAGDPSRHRLGASSGERK